MIIWLFKDRKKFVSKQEGEVAFWGVVLLCRKLYFCKAMPFSTRLYRLLEELEAPLRRALLGVMEELEQSRLQMVTKNEFNELKAVVHQLAEAQKKTEERLNELAEAQKRTEERVNELAEAQKKTEERLNELVEAQKRTEERVNELAEAQKKTEERLNELVEAQKRTEERVNELAEAQKRTEERLNELAEAQRKTEERVNELAEAQKKMEERLNELAEAQKRTEERLSELAEAQKRTEEELRLLANEHRKTRQQLGRLTHTVGYVLEDRAFKGLPPLLKEDWGLIVKGRLDRHFIEVAADNYVEINIFGKGEINGKEVLIVGEGKSQLLSKKPIDDLIKKGNLVSKLFGKEVFLVAVAYLIHPKVREYATAKGVKLYSSSYLPLA